MKTSLYNKFKKDFIPYFPCGFGDFAVHKKTNTIILLQYYFKQDFSCKVLQIENGKKSFCDVYYNENELQQLNISLSEFKYAHDEFTGIQLTLF